MLNEIKEYFGTRKCTSLQINCPSDEIINIPSKKIRFCEAVQYSFDVPLLINMHNIGCVGAARNLGFHKKSDDELTLLISENTGIPRNYVREMLQDTPPIKISLDNIYLGITEKMEEHYIPDFYIVYTTPDKILQLIHERARKKLKRLFISSHSLLSICGNVFVHGYNSGDLCVSFGCPESRKYGGVAKNEVIVGFPGSITHELLDNKYPIALH